MNKTLICYAVENNDGWEAICVDFDIAVQGKTFNEVYETLGMAICTYIEDVAKEAPDQHYRLLHRAVPWYVKLPMQLRFLRAWLLSNKDNNGGSAGFTLPCNA